MTNYLWERNGRDLSRPCECGGTIRGYTVEPPRSVYLNHIMVCDGPNCEQVVIHEGQPNERRGRTLILLG